MMGKAEIIREVLAHFVKMIGLNYSNTYRYNFYKGGSADCSSLTGGCWFAGRFPLIHKDTGKELWTSCYQVYAKGFDLIYPKSYGVIGDKLPSDSGLITSIGVQPGDIVFYNFKPDTPRDNMITHVGMVYDSKRIIHIANNREKCCFKDITYGNKHICAIIRLRNDVQALDLPILNAGTKYNKFARIMQVKLNVTAGNPKLLCDGKFGSKTTTALNKYKASIGLPKNSVCDDLSWNVLYPEMCESQKIEVIGKAVNVRDADSTKGNVIGIVRKGEQYPCIGQAPSGWYIIKYFGKLAYISNRADLTKVGIIDYVQVIGGSVNVRSGRTVLSKILGVAHKGDKFELVKRDGWYCINYNEQKAYISNRSDLTKII